MPKLSKEDEELVLKVAEVISKKYSRRSRVSREDLFQEAACAALNALQKVDRSRPTFEAYVYRSAARACGDLCWSTISAAKVCPWGPGAQAVSLNEWIEPVTHPNLVERVDQSRMVRVVQRGLRALVDPSLAGVILEDEKYTALAKRLGVSYDCAHQRVLTAKQKVREYALRKLGDDY